MIKNVVLTVIAIGSILFGVAVLLSPISYGEYYWSYKNGWYPKQTKFEQGMTLYPHQSAGIPMIFQIPKGSTLCFEPDPNVSRELWCKED